MKNYFYKRKYRFQSKIIAAVSFFIFFLSINSFCSNLIIAKNKKTDYKIFVQNKTPLNQFAAEELSYFLSEITGAEFQINSSDTSKNKQLIIGADTEKCNVIPENNFLISTEGSNIIFYGNGKHASLNAVYHYLEYIIGVQWFSAYGDIKIPKMTELKHSELNLQISYPFRIRSTQTFMYKKNPRQAALFFYRNRQNQLLTESKGIECLEFEYEPKVHTLSKYIHPGLDYYGKHEKTGRFHKQFEWIENKNYFTSNPEWFPMNKEGERYTHGQLCFSNLQMRQELFKNAFFQLNKEIEQTGIKDGVFTLDLTDIVYEEFCYCSECKKLNEKYNSKGGAFFELLFEFCEKVKNKYPSITIKTLGYFHTLKAPENIAIPKNLIVIFCPIYANYLAPLEIEKDQKTLAAIQSWAIHDTRVWYWYYTLPYLSGQKEYLCLPPIANLSRIKADIKTLKKLKTEGTYFEHDSGALDRTNFFELQTWLLLKLFQNPDNDLELLIDDFCKFYYGKAAKLFKEYLYEVDKENMSLAKQNFRAVFNTLAFPYLNEENLSKWSKMFDEMEALVQNERTPLHHIKLARIGLESTLITIKAQTKPWEEISSGLQALKKEIIFLIDDFDYPLALSRFDSWQAHLQEIIKNRETVSQ